MVSLYHHCIECTIVLFVCQISEDVSEENFVTILKPTQTIVTGNVVTPTTEHMNTLKV